MDLRLRLSRPLLSLLEDEEEDDPEAAFLSSFLSVEAVDEEGCESTTWLVEEVVVVVVVPEDMDRLELLEVWLFIGVESGGSDKPCCPCGGLPSPGGTIPGGIWGGMSCCCEEMSRPGG